ncbi:MAG: response regulator transcription factor [Cyclobacteriaceae bacterium]|nr:response regulator transcription factor [Cyclobacteriaceae bacterium]
MRMINIALAEDMPNVRRSIVRYLHTEKDMRVVLEAKDGLELVDGIRAHIKPDVILTDIRMPVMDGIEATRIILEDDPSSKIIAWTIFEDEEHVVAMSRLGVKSFLGKNDLSEVFKAIRIVNEGGVYLPDKIGKILREYLDKESDAEICPISLSKLEETLVKAICNGYSSSKIGDLIGKSPRTIEDYRNRLYEKFQVCNKEQFIVKATKWKLI